MNQLSWLKNLDYPEYSYQSKGSDHLLDLSLNDYEGSTSIFLPVLKRSITSVGEYSFAQDKELINLIRKENWGIRNKQIAITAGADGALRVIFKAIFNENKDKKICIPIPSFSRYEYHAKSNNVEIDFFQIGEFPYKVNHKKLLEHLKGKNPTAIVLANPNNPTGIYLQTNNLKDLLNKYKGFIIIDESLLFNDLEGLHLMTKKFKNLIIVRTFSKLYGIAGERIGYMIAHERTIKLIKKLLSPFEVSSISIELAKTVMRNKDTMESRTLELKEAIEYIKENLPKGFEISPTSSSVFILKCKKNINLYKSLLKKGVRTISCKDFRGIGSENTVRIAITNLKSMQKLFTILERL
jgi:histidinol-phosphate aminotransferase